MYLWKLVWQRTGMGRSRQETPKELLRSLLRGSQTGNSTSLSLKTSSQTRLQPLGAFRQGSDLSELCRKATISSNCFKTTRILPRCHFMTVLYQSVICRKAPRSCDFLKTTRILPRRHFMTVFAFVLETEIKKTCPCWLIYIAKQYLFVCCYLSLPRNFHSHGDVTIICEGLHSSTLAVIEQWRFLSVPHLLRRSSHRISEKPMTFTSLDERRTVKIGLSLDRGQDSNPELSASEAIEK